jgi:hypothetical protein
MATLPDSRRERTLGDLPRGQSGWTVPWAMSADLHGRLWLRGDYTLADSPRGTVSMLVRHQQDGSWEVDVPPSENYRPGPSLHPAWNPIPVDQANWVDHELTLTADTVRELAAST